MVYKKLFAEIGNYGDTGTIELHPFNHVVSKSATIYGIRRPRQVHFIRGMRLIESEPELFEKMITHTYPLDALNDIFSQLSKSYAIDGKMSIKVAVMP